MTIISPNLQDKVMTMMVSSIVIVPPLPAFIIPFSSDSPRPPRRPRHRLGHRRGMFSSEFSRQRLPSPNARSVHWRIVGLSLIISHSAHSLCWHCDPRLVCIVALYSLEILSAAILSFSSSPRPVCPRLVSAAH